jgi:hypothetical protein
MRKFGVRVSEQRCAYICVQLVAQDRRLISGERDLCTFVWFSRGLTHAEHHPPIMEVLRRSLIYTH